MSENPIRVPVMSLMMLKADTQVRVVSIGGGHGMRHRLAEMGVKEGSILKVIRNSSGGPVIVEVMGGRLVVGRGMAARVFVEAVG